MCSLSSQTSGIDPRTLQTLDWDVVLEALSEHARTARGQREALTPDFAPTRQAVLDRYVAVGEVMALETSGSEPIPVGGVSDVGELIASAGGRRLEPEELRGIGHCLVALRGLRRWLDTRWQEAPRLRDLADPIEIDAELVDTLDRSFDETGELSERMYPELADLRHRIRSLTGRIRSVLDELLGSERMSGMLQDSFITERSGRYVLPVKANYKRSVGVVHGTSQSGETVYVEPLEVIEHTNELKEAQAALIREIRRILTMLSAAVAAEAPILLASLDAAAQIDLAVARAGLGITLSGHIPSVGQQGVLTLQAARHPVLQLRGVDVIGNDLSLTDTHPGLVLTGPNAGGKTVALKTYGLCALMVRAGLPLPAGADSRADFFAHISADIGDLQTIEGDLSTFSGHLQALKAVLTAAGPGSLVLLDEAGMGTNPAQGAALAQAVVQTLVDSGARLVVTTHYSRLKALPSSDERFRVGAVRFVDGRPTYHLDLGMVGESHALAIARRLTFPDPVIERARVLLDEGERRLDELVTSLENERGEVRRLKADMAARREALKEQQATLAHQERKLTEKRLSQEGELTARFRRRLLEREEEVKSLIAALQADPDLKAAGQTLQSIRSIRQRSTPAPVAEPTSPPPADLKEGDRVRLRRLGSRGRVLKVLPRDQFEVQVGNMRMKVELSELEEGEPILNWRAEQKARAPRLKETLPPEVKREFVGVRTPSNTCDLRGQRVDEALEMSEMFLDELVCRKEPVAYLLHGHGTGALKGALRQWLPQCHHARRWRPAMAHEGGDAFTLVELI